MEYQAVKALGKLIGAFLFILCPSQLFAQQWDDDILISTCNDQYLLQMNGTLPIVKNKQEYTYESNTASSVVAESSILYGDNITLDHASGPGEKEYKNVTPENVFYDDTKLCTISSPLRKKGKTAEVSFSRTFNDIKYFTRVYLLEDYFIKSKTVTITIPKTLAGYHIREMNFKGFPIVSHHTTTADGDIYTYTLTNARRTKDDRNMPPESNVYPYLLILGSFPSVDDLYKWSMAMADVDCKIPDLQTVLQEIDNGCKSDEERISNTYHWVQSNIRYVAFEAGMSGFRPDTPAEVVRKRYGDCKGMALLLKTLLKAQGFDARLTDIGTDLVPYHISDAPTLAATNHAICTLLFKGKYYFLDATCSYIPYTYIPQYIQGSEAMIENGDKPLLKIVPTLNIDESIDSLHYEYHLDGETLSGKAVYQVRGDMKAPFLALSEKVGNKDNDELLAANLNSDNHSMNVSDVKWLGRDSRQQWAQFEGKVSNSAAVQNVDGELYIELNPHNNVFSERIDTTKRENDYLFDIRCNIVREAILSLPADYQVSFLPESATFRTPGAILSCSFSKSGNDIIYHQKMQILHRRLPLSDIPNWNETLSKWEDACNQQVILKKK
jgi:transglutaminase-like putative cysteine protease